MDSGEVGSTLKNFFGVQFSAIHRIRVQEPVSQRIGFCEWPPSRSDNDVSRASAPLVWLIFSDLLRRGRICSDESEGVSEYI